MSGGISCLFYPFIHFLSSPLYAFLIPSQNDLIRFMKRIEFVSASPSSQRDEEREEMKSFRTWKWEMKDKNTEKLWQSAKFFLSVWVKEKYHWNLNWKQAKIQIYETFPGRSRGRPCIRSVQRRVEKRRPKRVRNLRAKWWIEISGTVVMCHQKSRTLSSRRSALLHKITILFCCCKNLISFVRLQNAGNPIKSTDLEWKWI